jgi:hypothetical protein
VTRVAAAGEVALVVFRWSTSRPDGTVADQGTGVDVVRRQPDGTWKYLIGLPAGTPTRSRNQDGMKRVPDPRPIARRSGGRENSGGD